MPTLEQFKAVKQKISAFLLSPLRQVETIHGVGVGRDEANNYHVRIYVTQHEPRALELLVGALGLPALPPTFPVFYTENGERYEIREILCPIATLAVTTAPMQDYKQSNDCRRDKPLYKGGIKKTGDLDALSPGISIGLDDGTIGTIGYFCTKNGESPTKTYILSNCHVLSKLTPTSGQSGPTIVRSVRTANGLTDAEIATLLQAGAVQLATGNSNTSYPPNKLDAAIALAKVACDPDLPGKGKFKGKVEKLYYRVTGAVPKDSTGRTSVPVKQRVSKHGYTSCWTGGFIDDVDCDFLLKLDDSGQKVFFVNQFRIQGLEKIEHENEKKVTFATRGDSGSLVFQNPSSALKKGENKVLASALVFAIGYDPEIWNAADIDPNTIYTLATPISVVEGELGIKLIVKTSATS